MGEYGGPSEETIALLVEAAKRPIRWLDLAELAGVRDATLRRWRQRGRGDIEAGDVDTPYAQLVAGLQRSRAVGRLARLEKIESSDDWRAHAHLLSLEGYTKDRNIDHEMEGDAGSLSPRDVLRMWVERAPHVVRQMLAEATAEPEG